MNPCHRFWDIWVIVEGTDADRLVWASRLNPMKKVRTRTMGRVRTRATRKDIIVANMIIH